MEKIAISVELEKAVFNQISLTGKASALIAEGIRLALEKAQAGEPAAIIEDRKIAADYARWQGGGK
jgi:hypothetical protein